MNDNKKHETDTSFMAGLLLLSIAEYGIENTDIPDALKQQIVDTGQKLLLLGHLSNIRQSPNGHKSGANLVIHDAIKWAVDRMGKETADNE